MASPNNLNFPPYYPFQPTPPPPNRPVTPPPPPPPHVRPPPAPTPPSPHVLPPPAPIPPSPSPSNNTTVIVVVFVSFGGLLLLAFLAAALCCFIKKKKKKTKETDVVHVDEHLKVKNATRPGPHGEKDVVLEIEDDLHVDKVIRKNEEFGKGHGLHLHAKSSEDKASAAFEVGTSASARHHHDQLQNKA